MRSRLALMLPVAALCACATPAIAATPRDILLDAAFQTRDKDAALAKIAEADRAAAALVARNPADRDAVFVRAMALGYRAKLTRSRGDALEARKQFEKLAAADPRDPDATAAVGTWHLDSTIDLGGFVADFAIGAKKAKGLQLMDRAVTLGGHRAMYPGLAALLRLALDPADPRGRALADMASKAEVVEPLDRVMQRNAVTILASLKAGDGSATQKLARQLLPFGRVAR